MAYEITLIPGDGIGPEITEQTVRLVEATGVAIRWDVRQAGMTAMNAEGNPLPEATLASIRERKVALKGPLTTPVGGGFRSVNVELRKTFDLYANVRPAITVLPGRYEHVDIVRRRLASQVDVPHRVHVVRRAQLGFTQLGGRGVFGRGGDSPRVGVGLRRRRRLDRRGVRCR